tara:strand:+ start:2615 stop:3391 length:777 start_codon:yes stop_codon:yes gene_type:complete
MDSTLYEFYYNENVSINEYFFLVACETGYKDWLQWAYYIDGDLKYNIRNNLPLLLACERDDLEIARYIVDMSPNIEFNDIEFVYCELIDNNYKIALFVYDKFRHIYDSFTCTQLLNIFVNWCLDDASMALWLFERFSYIPIQLDNHYLFINACEMKNIDMATLFMRIKPEWYYLCYVDDTIIHWEVNYILKPYNSIKRCEMSVPYENCYICYEDVSNVITKCNHFYCLSCLQRHYEKNNINCPYCRKENTENELYTII